MAPSSLLLLSLLVAIAVVLAPASAQTAPPFRFAFCLVLTYQPTVANGYFTSVTFSGVFNSSATGQAASPTNYTVTAVSGQRTVSTLVAPSTVISLTSTTTGYGGDQLLLYPLPANGIGVDTKGVTLYGSAGEVDTLYLTANGTAAYKVGTSAPAQGQPQTSTFTLLPYDSSVPPPACVAPPVQLLYQFAFCYIALYQPTVANTYTTSLTISGVLNTTGVVYGGSTPLYLAQAVSGRRNVSTLLASSTLDVVRAVYAQYGANNLLQYPPSASGAPVDAKGITLYTYSGYYTLYLTANGSVSYLFNGAAPAQGQPNSSTLTLFPYDSSVPLTAQGTLPSCVAPPVQLVYQFAFCFVAVYQPTVANGYYTSVTLSGVLNTTGAIYGGNTTMYLVQAASGQRNVATLLAPSTVTTIQSFETTAYGADNFVLYPPPANGVPLDSKGINVYANEYDTLYLTGNGTVGLQRNGATPQGPFNSSTLALFPYDSSVSLTAQGTLPSCVAPPVQLVYQFAFCFVAVYQPTVANGYYTSITLSGVLNTTGAIYGGNTTMYLVQAASGQRVISTLTSPSTIVAIQPFVTTSYGADNFLLYPPPTNGVPLDSKGINVYANEYDTLYLTGNGTVGLQRNGATSQGQLNTSTLTLLPNNPSVQLSPLGTLPSCTAPPFPNFFQFAFCYVALYTPTVANSYYTSLVLSGVLNTTGLVYGGATTQYVALQVSGQRNLSTLTAPTTLDALRSVYTQYGADNLVSPSANGPSVDAKGLTLYTYSGYYTLYLTANGSVSYLFNGAAPAQGQPNSSTLTLFPYDSSVPLTAQGTLPSCVAPPVQLVYQFAFCFIAVYQPTVANGYYTSVTFSGVLNTTGAIYGGNTTMYLVQSAVGSHGISTLLVPAAVYPFTSAASIQYGSDNLLSYPPVPSSLAIDGSGVTLYAFNEYDTLYRTANGTVDYRRYGQTPPQGASQNTTLTLFPYDTTVLLTPQGALPSCVAPPVQLLFQFAFCFIAVYQPTVANGYYTSTTISGVFNTTGAIYGGNTTQYLVQSAAGSHVVSTLLVPAAVYPFTGVAFFQYDSSDNLLSYPPLPGSSAVDGNGISFYSGNEYTTLYRTGNGTIDYKRYGQTTPQGPTQSTSFVLLPYNTSVTLTASGALPSCVAPPVQLVYQFAFCFIAVYQPTVANGYYTSVTLSGVLNTTGAIYGGNTTMYLVQAASGQRNVATLLAPSTVTTIQPYETTGYGADNFLLYPPPTNGVPLDSKGISVYANEYDTLYLTSNGTVGLLRYGSTPAQGLFNYSTFAVFPYDSTVQLTAQGSVASCNAPPVQVVFQFAFCFVAQYQPTAANGYATSLTLTGVFVTTGAIYGGNTTMYLLQSVAGQQNVSSLTTGSTITALNTAPVGYYGDNFLFYPPLANGSYVDTLGVTVQLATGNVDTLYLTSSGAVGRLYNNAAPSQGQPIATAFAVIPYDPNTQLTPQGATCPAVQLPGTQTASLCILLYALPGSVDYPFSIAYSLHIAYNFVLLTTTAGTGITISSANGTRTYTDRFGDSFSTPLTLTPGAGQPVLYLNSRTPLRSSALVFNLSSPVQLPGADPTQLVSTTTLSASAAGVIAETGASIFDAAGQAVLSSVLGVTNLTIGASNQNALAAVYATCQAPITFTNNLRTPTEPVVGNGAVHFTYSYTVSDGATFSVQANLSVTATSGFATTIDQLGNPYQTVVNITGTRLYTHLPTNQTLLSTVTGIAASILPPQADQRFYPYSLLASAPGVYTINTAPFVDAAGLAYNVSPAVPADGQPVVSSAMLYGSVGVYLNTATGAALLAESNMAGAVGNLVAARQRQTFVLG